MNGRDIAVGAPSWVYILLAVLLLLGIRRLKTRDVPVLVALIPSAAFLIWSLIGANAFASRVGFAIAVTTWLVGAGIGAVSAITLPDPRGLRLPDARVRQPGSWLPLILYISVFVIRFACGAWAAIHPAQADAATAIGIAVGAAVTLRLLVGVTRWRPYSPLTAA